MKIMAIDPGNEQSAYVVLDGTTIVRHGKVDNLEMLNLCYELGTEYDVAIEMIASFGMPVGETVFRTCLWIGRFFEACCFELGPTPTLLTRIEVKNHLCHSSRAKDAHIRQALLDRFGGKDVAIGRKAKPGPLYGLKADTWSALAVGLTFADQRSAVNFAAEGK